MMVLMKVKLTMLQKNGAGGANQRRLAHAEVRGADRAGLDAVCRVAHEHLAGLLPGSRLHTHHHGHQTHQQHVRVHATLISCYSSFSFSPDNFWPRKNTNTRSLMLMFFWSKNEPTENQTINCCLKKGVKPKNLDIVFLFFGVCVWGGGTVPLE